jgi:hypothetical protein
VEPTSGDAEAICRLVRCPVLIVHGDQDGIVPHETGAALAHWTGAHMVTIHGGGHAPTMRDPVQTNLLIRASLSPSAQHPVSELLRPRGELIHPASAFLASESGHIDSFGDEAAEHDLHAFQAIRNMDEILVSNFMVFDDLVRDEHFDLWVGDEAWDIDYFLHENPELKRAPYAWMTDFVGWLPMLDGGDRERVLTADYNAEMIEQIARFPGLRDRSVFVGNPGDVVPDTFGDGLPQIRGWVEQNYQFSGYITGISATELADRDAVRADLGYRADEKVCVVTAGGSGVGTDLLRRVTAAFPEASRLIPGLWPGPGSTPAPSVPMTGLRSMATFTTYTAISRPAISRLCKAA